MTDIGGVRKPPVIACAVLFGLALIVAALFSRPSAGAARATTKTPSVVRVVERDFHISVVHGHLTAGTVVFRVTNRGPDEHEFIVVRADHGLPMRPDGITLDEHALEKNIAGSIEPAPAGQTNTLRVTLKSGRYALVCNMFGHYMGGMHAPLVVR
ncbi:MAG TPA: hypothetical protein VGI77_07685 [Gaiellaceae bacterium]|jgi:uncharacterized cupredoxin-like copper-binding protein